jgi:hypothetical protein
MSHFAQNAESVNCPAVWLCIRVQRLREKNCGVSLLKADEESGVDGYEFARRRTTAAAYGLSGWTEMRERG